MKKLINHSRAILAIAMMLSVALPSLAYDFEIRGIYYNFINATTVAVTSGEKKYTGNIKIPSSVTYYDGTVYSVTSIRSSAFSDCSDLTSITIPNSVTSIGSSAFYGCSGLTSISIPNSITSIGSSAFDGCSGLTSISIPNSITSIGSSAFYGCSGLTEVNISDLSAWCKIFFENYNANPLSYARKLKLNGSEIKDLVIPNDITQIKNYAFYGCSGLTSVTIGNSLTSIGDFAFNNCSGLTSVTIPNSVKKIGNKAFIYCSRLTEVTIPNSVTSIGKNVFESCSSLTTVNYNAKKCTIDGASSYHIFRNCDNLKTINIGNEVNTIPNYTFYRCSGLTSVIIPNSVTSIGGNAFGDCSGLTSVTIGNSVTSIGPGAFFGCSGLTSVIIPNSVTSIGSSAFSGCSGLTTVTIPNSVTSIGTNPFFSCSGLLEVKVESGNAKYDSRNNCNAIIETATNTLIVGCKNTLIPNSVTSIGDFAFNNCTGLISVIIPNSVTSIGNDAFSNCDGLTSVTIGNSVTSIGDFAFCGCSGLTSVIIPNSVTSIRYGAFQSCSSLNLVLLGKSVHSIGESAFCGTYSLNKIISLNPNLPQCEDNNTFDSNNYSEATLYVPQKNYSTYDNSNWVWWKFSLKKIENLVSSIKLNNNAIKLDKGSTATLSATVAPKNATIKDIIWESSNPKIALVDHSGKVTALSAGTVSITAKATDGSEISASCNVEVKDVKTIITLSQTEANLPVNELLTLSYTVTPLAIPIEWSTSDANVAYLKKNSDNSVYVVGMADGEATITASATDGSGASASCKVIVGVGGIEGVEADYKAVEVARYDIHGRILAEPTKGINIIKMSDGTIIKEFVK